MIVRSGRCVLAALAALLAAAPAFGAILYESPTRNTTRPPDDLGGPAWDLQGNWGSFTGTPIGKRFFIASNHVGGSTGQSFVLNGVPYAIDSTFNGGLGYVARDDLRLWKVTADLPAWAPIYNVGNEAGLTATIIGRGTPRGDAVMVNGQLKGWKWGNGDGARSWGRNMITGYYNSPTYGKTFVFDFDAAGIDDESTLSTGDSSGGVFANFSGTWGLLGINLAVTGPFNTTNSGSGFNAAIFDMGGLYVRSGGQWVYVPDHNYDIPASGYVMRLSQYIGWIDDYVPANELRLVPEPATIALLLLGGSALAGAAFRRRPRRVA